MKIYIFLILLCCIMTDCLAQAPDDEKTSRDILTPRKGKHHLLYFLGGLQGLVAFVILKIKIVLVVITIIGAALLALKFLGLFKYSNYVYKSNYPIIEGPPAFEYGNPFSHDHKMYEEYKDEWSAGSPYHRINQRSNSGELINEFLAKTEEIILPLMNFSNKECHNRTICQLTALINSSLNFSECEKIYTNCDEDTPENTSKKRIRRQAMR